MNRRSYAEATQRVIDEEVTRLLKDAEERARTLLTENRGAVEELVALLLERETVDGEDVYRILGRLAPGRREEAEPAEPAVAHASSEPKRVE